MEQDGHAKASRQTFRKRIPFLSYGGDFQELEAERLRQHVEILRSRGKGGHKRDFSDLETERKNAVNPGHDLADLDIRLSEAKLAWQGRIYNHALQAAGAKDASGKPGRENSLKDIRDLGEEVSFRISQFLYHLSAYGMDSGKELERRMRAQNESLDSLCNDPNYQLRTGYKLDRLRDMRFSENTIEHAAMIVDYYKRPVINETVLAGFLVRLAGKSNINRCLKVFEKTRLIETKKGPSNSKLIYEFGKLVDAYEAYLKDVSEAIKLHES